VTVLFSRATQTQLSPECPTSTPCLREEIRKKNLDMPIAVNSLRLEKFEAPDIATFNLPEWHDSIITTRHAPVRI